MAFAYAYLAREYVPIQVVTTLFFIEFALRVAARPAAQSVRLLSRLADARQRAALGVGQAQALRLERWAW